MENEYAELKQLVKQEGLLDKQPVYYTYKILLTLCLLAASLSILVVVDNLWLQLLNAAFFAVVFTQIGLVAHDAGHLQIFRSASRSSIILLPVIFFIALDLSWWLEKHNRHHRNPNHIDLDWDINLPIIGFTRKQVLAKRGLYRFIAKYQAYFIFFAQFLEAFSARLDSIKYLIHGKKVRYLAIESLLMAAHFAVYLALLFYFLSAWHAILFIIVHQGIFGFYLSMIFATNHKGMQIIYEGNRLGFIREQVVTARDVKSNFIISFLYGGLEYQIEHHLFPNMPRNNLRKAKKIVKPFCEERGIPYCEAGIFESYIQITKYLHKVSAVLRNPDKISV